MEGMTEFYQLTDTPGVHPGDAPVRSYIETGRPVGSKTLVEDFGLDISSATVRHDLSVLGELGYVAQLHTSAGRIPTESGYRYFVQKLLGEFPLPLHERQMIRHQFHQARLELDQWMRLSPRPFWPAPRAAPVSSPPPRPAPTAISTCN